MKTSMIFGFALAMTTACGQLDQTETASVEQNQTVQLAGLSGNWTATFDLAKAEIWAGGIVGSKTGQAYASVADFLRYLCDQYGACFGAHASLQRTIRIERCATSGHPELCDATNPKSYLMDDRSPGRLFSLFNIVAFDLAHASAAWTLEDIRGADLTVAAAWGHALTMGTRDVMLGKMKGLYLLAFAGLVEYGDYAIPAGGLVVGVPVSAVRQ